ncbi:TniQ family protein [Streptomyces roseochromogenus]|uniref:TniQ domain-containing protein n=1 Tax=Streptomyces roseochromogenus subsp. oscitans DS 12.976 TaxID=1352936 RepID=V6JMT7_STRRC|nr:TniQ family protein [Streptomyces roseochromogenus]EST17873.1 hypothetical protein M878_46275 [Streptomyces roseochromogenus subsp. oscitans DS 12.976]EST18149.1 hypothetical protein M878_45600 [Streptomyces roseochromogenus subsp. oscitans DS 12.976]EST36873.1 hypothetical protein M878_00070 [Streptomyces roseochromogenus subsp. oscitans DS 12.976]
MPTTNTGPKLAPLPMQVRPVLGEGIASYIQRLAQANHLSPDELTAVLCPRGRARPPELHLLAQLTNSTVDALRRALPDAPGRVNTDPNRAGPFPQRVDHALPSLFDRVDLLMALGEALHFGVHRNVLRHRYPRLRRHLLRLALQHQPRQHRPPHLR